MKKLLIGLISFASFSSIGQINLATRPYQDTNIKVLRQIRNAIATGTAVTNTVVISGTVSANIVNSPSVTVLNPSVTISNPSVTVLNPSVTVTDGTTSITGAVNVSTLCGLTNLNILATLAKQNQAITSATISEGYLQSMEFSQVNSIDPNIASILVNIGYLQGAIPTSSYSTVVFEQNTLALLKTAIDAWIIGAGAGTTIISINYSSYAYNTGMIAVTKYNALVTYR